MAAETEPRVRYELHHDQLFEVWTIQRVEILGPFESRAAARAFMLATEDARKARDDCPHREQRRDEHDVFRCLNCGAYSHGRSLEAVLEVPDGR